MSRAWFDRSYQLAREVFAGGHTSAQAIRFIVVGVKSNLVYFLLYALLAVTGVEPKIAVVLVYLFSIAYTFVFNRSFVFRSESRLGEQFSRYLAVYGVALTLNLILLDWTVKYLQLNHFLAQAILGPLNAVPIFLLLKFFVFRERRVGTPSDGV